MTAAGRYALGITGGPAAPSRAREAVDALLHGLLCDARRREVLLLVSELVTNSVVHAGVGPAEKVRIEVTVDDPKVRIAVIDRGSDEAPRMRPRDRESAGGVGLFLVDEASDDWGVERDRGRTAVWFEVHAK